MTHTFRDKMNGKPQKRQIKAFVAMVNALPNKSPLAENIDSLGEWGPGEDFDINELWSHEAVQHFFGTKDAFNEFFDAYRNEVFRKLGYTDKFPSSHI